MNFHREGSGAPATSPADSVDDISAHLPQAGGVDRAALLPGMYLAWCARLGLLERSFAEQHAEHILRLHYNDGSCVEMLVVACGGTLRFEHLNERGTAFTRRYYPKFVDDWRSTFGEDIYSVMDSWENYNKIAAVLTQALMGSPAAARSREVTATGGRRQWWRFWKNGNQPD